MKKQRYELPNKDTDLSLVDSRTYLIYIRTILSYIHESCCYGIIHFDIYILKYSLKIVSSVTTKS